MGFFFGLGERGAGRPCFRKIERSSKRFALPMKGDGIGKMMRLRTEGSVIARSGPTRRSRATDARGRQFPLLRESGEVGRRRDGVRKAGDRLAKICGASRATRPALAAAGHTPSGAIARRK